MRAWRPIAGLSALLAAATAAFADDARAQGCESARPTEAQGSQGVSYGQAEVDFFDAASGRARVHFAVSGPHAPPSSSTLQSGLPDAVIIAGQAADDALDTFERLGYAAPLSDGGSPCANHGDSDAIDIYLINFAAADGQALPDHCQPGLPKHCAGFILVENDFRRGGYADAAEGLRTVVPHELFHLVQDAYDADVERWWAEGSAQWAAKQVYLELRDLERFLPDYFEAPWRPLNVPPNGVITNFLYATAIWPVFLSERFDTDVVRAVYEGFAEGDASVLRTTDDVLQARGSSLGQEFLNFAAYNAATGERAPDHGGYANAAEYPLVSLTALGGTQGELVSDVGSGLGAFYYSFELPAPTALTLEADPARMAALLVPVTDGELRLSEARPLPTTFEGQGVLVVAGQSLARTDAPFTLRARASEATPAGADAAPEASGCSLTAAPGLRRSFGGIFALVVVSLLGRRRARSCPKSDQERAV